MAFGRKVTFGKKKTTFQEMRQTMQPTPDDDGVTRVFPKELWDDPEVGGFLKEMGFEADDARNILPTPEDYKAKFAAAQDRLKARMDAFNADMTQRHGYCQARPFLVIDSAIWDGPDGAFLYAQLDLVGYDDWNVIMLAGDPQTKQATGLPGHPGIVPEIRNKMMERVSEWKRRYEFLLETFGLTATGGLGISHDQFEAEKAALEREIVDYVQAMKPRICAELDRVQAGD